MAHFYSDFKLVPILKFCFSLDLICWRVSDTELRITLCILHVFVFRSKSCLGFFCFLSPGFQYLICRLENLFNSCPFCTFCVSCSVRFRVSSAHFFGGFTFCCSFFKNFCSKYFFMLGGRCLFLFVVIKTEGAWNKI